MVVMDCYMPAGEAAALVRHVRAAVPVSTPLWLCPVRGRPGPGAPAQPLSPHGHRAGLLVNVGVYGRVCDGEVPPPPPAPAHAPADRPRLTVRAPSH